MATFRGKGVLYGLGSTSFVSGSATVSCSFQSSDWAGKVDEETIMDCNGEVATHITKNPTQTLSVSYVYTEGTNDGGVTVSIVPAGSVITITDVDEPQAAGTWLVTSVGIKRTNTSAAIVDMGCTRYSTITYT